MKLANVNIEGNITLGALKDGFILDTHVLGGPILQNTLEWITAEDTVKQALSDLVHAADVAALAQSGHAFAMGDDRLVFLPAVSTPQKIICVGHNFRTHILEMNREIPSHPMIFAKYNNVLAGHKEVIPIPEVSEQFDYEAELAFVVGKRAKNVPREAALGYVAGYTVANDLSVRDYQRRTLQFLQGKSFDKSGPMGPVMITTDELQDVDAEVMTLRLNGQIMQQTPLSDMVFSVSELVHQLSECMTLEPGDVVLTGTPGGVGAARKPPVWIRHGDTVEVSISNVGVLRNTFKLLSKAHQFPNVSDMKTSLQEDQKAYQALLGTISESKLHHRPYADNWTIAEAVAHITEAIDFFRQESLTALAHPEEKVGRHKTHPRRLARIAEHGTDSAAQLLEALNANIEACLGFLESLTDQDLQRIIHHKYPKFGDMKLGAFLDHFMVGHSKSHVKQVQNLLAWQD